MLKLIVLISIFAAVAFSEEAREPLSRERIFSPYALGFPFTYASPGGAYAGPGGAYAGPGGAYAGHGVAYTGPGGAYTGPGVAHAGRGGAYAGHGVAYTGPGGAYTGPGVAYAGRGGAYAGHGVAYTGPGGAYTGPGVASAGPAGAVAAAVGPYGHAPSPWSQPQSFFPFNWSPFPFPQNWIEEKNVCKEVRTRNDDNPDEFDKWLKEDCSNVSSDYEQCKSSNTNFVCIKRIVDNGKAKLQATKYECCPGFVRNPNGAPGCV